MLDQMEQPADKLIYMLKGTSAERRTAALAAARHLTDIRHGGLRPEAVIHCTLVVAGLFEDSRTMSRAIDVARMVRLSGFALAFDAFERFDNGIAAFTCSRWPRAFSALGDHLSQAARGLGRKKEGGANPHLSMAYNCDPFETVRLAEPIVWNITEFQLIHSVFGKTSHDQEGRWPLL